MGQYYKPTNLDKKQYLYSHAFGDGLKLLEFGCSANGMMTALAILLADGNGRGGGDLHSDHPIIGSWAGDRVVVAGDYADEGKFLPDDQKIATDEDGEYDTGHVFNVYSWAEARGEDISHLVMQAMLDDQWVATDIARSWLRTYEGSPLKKCIEKALDGSWPSANANWQKAVETAKKQLEAEEAERERIRALEKGPEAVTS